MDINQSFPQDNPMAIQSLPLAANHRNLAEESSIGSVPGIAPALGMFVQPC